MAATGDDPLADGLSLIARVASKERAGACGGSACCRHRAARIASANRCTVRLERTMAVPNATGLPLAPGIEAGSDNLIKRPRLTRLLDEATAPIVMLIAPAGYGKTTLAREWFATRRHGWYRGSPAAADVAALALGLARDRIRDHPRRRRAHGRAPARDGNTREGRRASRRAPRRGPGGLAGRRVARVRRLPLRVRVAIRRAVRRARARTLAAQALPHEPQAADAGRRRGGCSTARSTSSGEACSR